MRYEQDLHPLRSTLFQQKRKFFYVELFFIKIHSNKKILDLPNEILAMTTKSRMFEKSWNKFMIFDFIYIFLFECSFPLTSHTFNLISTIPIGILFGIVHGHDINLKNHKKIKNEKKRKKKSLKIIFKR